MGRDGIIKRSYPIDTIRCYASDREAFSLAHTEIRRFSVLIIKNDTLQYYIIRHTIGGNEFLSFFLSIMTLEIFEFSS